MRLDKFLAEKFGSRTKAAAAIADGLVKVNGKNVAPSYDYKVCDEIEIFQAEERFVSNGGYKLSKALKDFGFSVDGMTVVDIGASTGGFTDCLLQNGAKKVYCIDVGENQLDKSLLDKNIVIIDNFNARDLNRSLFKEKLDLAVVDISFISLTYVLGNVATVLDDGAKVIALIKPQFECESRRVGKNGIVKDPQVHKRIIEKIYDFCIATGLNVLNLTQISPREGKNKEYLILLCKGGSTKINKNDINKYVNF